jgi:hypothetical protein
MNAKTSQQIGVVVVILLTLLTVSPSNAAAQRRRPRSRRAAPVIHEVLAIAIRPPEAYDSHVIELKKKLPNKDFSVAIEEPFVVIGNDRPEVVQQQAENTVRWAVTMLKQDFFERDPDKILDIWLFKDDVSYEKYAREIFGDEPNTPYGYYSPAHGALIMNISTGGGTLVHEIVHPFMEANFPHCPAWFNEGMGSLYEQSGEVNGHIHGFPNWRLPSLQAAIRARTVPSFKTLTSTTDAEFYNQDKGTNYAQARYLCYYLQERGLLVKFYRQFLANRATDPTGYQTLQRVLGVRSMQTFQKTWEQFVLKIERN